MVIDNYNYIEELKSENSLGIANFRIHPSRIKEKGRV
jgi:hypothetical protein